MRGLCGIAHNIVRDHVASSIMFACDHNGAARRQPGAVRSTGSAACARCEGRGESPTGFACAVAHSNAPKCPGVEDLGRRLPPVDFLLFADCGDAQSAAHCKRDPSRVRFPGAPGARVTSCSGPGRRGGAMAPQSRHTCMAGTACMRLAAPRHASACLACSRAAAEVIRKSCGRRMRLGHNLAADAATHNLAARRSTGCRRARHASTKRFKRERGPQRISAGIARSVSGPSAARRCAAPAPAAAAAAALQFAGGASGSRRRVRVGQLSRVVSRQAVGRAERDGGTDRSAGREQQRIFSAVTGGAVAAAATAATAAAGTAATGSESERHGVRCWPRSAGAPSVTLRAVPTRAARMPPRMLLQQ
eukprot:208170-Chlamydomonas_euryale.AAC.8